MALKCCRPKLYHRLICTKKLAVNAYLLLTIDSCLNNAEIKSTVIKELILMVVKREKSHYEKIRRSFFAAYNSIGPSNASDCNRMLHVSRYMQPAQVQTVLL